MFISNLFLIINHRINHRKRPIFTGNSKHYIYYIIPNYLKTFIEIFIITNRNSHLLVIVLLLLVPNSLNERNYVVLFEHLCNLKIYIYVFFPLLPNNEN